MVILVQLLMLLNAMLSLFTPEKLFLSKVRVESSWYHESQDFNILAVDAQCSAKEMHDRYAMAALFCYSTKKSIHTGMSPSSALAAATASNRSSRMSFSGVYSTPEPKLRDADFEEHRTYSIDIGTNDSERLQFEVS